MTSLISFIAVIVIVSLITCFWATILYLGWNLILVPLVGFGTLSFGLAILLVFVLSLVGRLLFSNH